MAGSSAAVGCLTAAELHQFTAAVGWTCGFAAVLAPGSKLTLSSAALFQMGLQSWVADTDSYQRNIPQDRRRGGLSEILSALQLFSLVNYFGYVKLEQRIFFRVRHSLPTLIICIKLSLRDFQMGRATSAGSHAARNWKGLQPSLQQFQSVLIQTGYRTWVNPTDSLCFTLSSCRTYLLYLRELL